MGITFSLESKDEAIFEMASCLFSGDKSLGSLESILSLLTTLLARLRL